jgi:hypothetical protein
VDIQTASYLAERNASHFSDSTKRQIHHGITDSSSPPQIISHATKRTPMIVDSQMAHNRRVLRRRGEERDLDRRSDIFVSSSRSRETPCCAMSFFSHFFSLLLIERISPSNKSSHNSLNSNAPLSHPASIVSLAIVGRTLAF